MIKRLLGLSLATQIIIGLAFGAAIGLLLPDAGTDRTADTFVAISAVGGQLWLHALQMTILPLVFALVSTIFVRAQGLGTGGRTTQRAIVTILGLYLVGVIIGVATTILLLDVSPVSEQSARAMRAMAGESLAADPLPWADAVLALVPTNVVTAMGGETLLPVLFFTLLFGAAITTIDGEGKHVLVSGLTAVADAIFVVVGWVLKVAPIGVALLILPTTHQFGDDIFGGLAHYIALGIVQMLLTWLAVYAMVILVGRVPIGRFAQMILPVQAVAFGTQSSTGCMPLTLKACREMGIGAEAADVTVPLSAVLFRISAPVSSIFICAYAADVYGIPYGIMLLLIVGLLASILEMSVVGIPGAAIFIATLAPLAAIVGFPIAFLAVVIVVEVFPDIIKTMVNVTAHALGASIVDRGAGAQAETTSRA